MQKIAAYGLISMTLLLQGCSTAPSLQGTSGNMIFLGENRADHSSCGYELGTYLVKARTTCRQLGYNKARLHSTHNASNRYCTERMTSASFVCE
jgi:hypothetical protein